MTAFLINEIDVRGGTHKQLLELLDHASDSGEEYVVLTKKLNPAGTYPGFERHLANIKVINDMAVMRWWKRFTVGWPSYIRYLRSQIASADVINIHGNGFEKYLVAFWGKRVIWQINDLPFVFQEGVGKRHIITSRDRFEKWRIRILTRLFVDRITVNVSKNAERVWRNLRKRADVLYCGVTPVEVSHDNSMTFGRFRKRKIVLLSSGVFYPYRNYETLVEAVGLLLQRGIEVVLNIFGSCDLCPEYYKKIKGIIETKRLEDYVSILGQVDEKKYQELHRVSDVFCFINVDQSWGLAVFEAMSAGLPVVVSKSVGATEILHNTYDSIMVDPMSAEEIAEQIIGLMNDREKYANMQLEGLRLVEKYSWEKAYCEPMIGLIRGLRK